jgi:hypothetical protein
MHQYGSLCLPFIPELLFLDLVLSQGKQESTLAHASLDLED